MDGRTNLPDIEAVKREIKLSSAVVLVLRAVLFAVTAINIMRLFAAIWRM